MASDIIKGLNVLMALVGDFAVCAEHDVIYSAMKPHPSELTPRDLAILEQTGWFWGDESGEYCWSHFC